MLADRIRKQFHGKPMSDLEEFLIQFYPLGQMMIDSSTKLTFDTGVSTAKDFVVVSHTVVQTGMCVDKDGNAQMYSGKV
jgi:hypothetical protein